MSDEVIPDERFAVPASAEALDRAAVALEKNSFTVHVVDTVADARALVNDLLPTDRSVFTANSDTVRESGLADDIDTTGRYQSVRVKLADYNRETDVDEMRRLGGVPDIVVGSVHAVTERGQLVATSASGSQLGPYAAGAGRAIWVVGSQKVVPDLETALRRTREYCLPKVNEVVRRLYNVSSFIGKTLIIDQELPDRSTVVLVREPIGF